MLSEAKQALLAPGVGTRRRSRKKGAFAAPALLTWAAAATAVVIPLSVQAQAVAARGQAGEGASQGLLLVPPTTSHGKVSCRRH